MVTTLKNKKKLSRRKFISQGGLGLLAISLPISPSMFLKYKPMNTKKNFDVIIIGGSYSGLAAGMALGRAFKQVLIIDGGKPCNQQTPFSHNFLTQDGKTPKEISILAKQQVENYNTVKILEALAVRGSKTEKGFEIETHTGNIYTAGKLIFATGVKDLLLNMDGFAECWGISVLHCPYCHGYEVRDEPTGVLGNGNQGFELVQLISNWTRHLTLFTNGKSTLTTQQNDQLKAHGIELIETKISHLTHQQGYLQNIVFSNYEMAAIKVLYAHVPMEQTSHIPMALGCELTEEGYIKTDRLQKTSVDGIYACGDGTSKIRTVANAVATGTTAGMMLNKEMVIQAF
jgi:thioredoxin reductase